MSTIAENLISLSSNIQNAYTALSAKGATMPESRDASHLLAAINSIPEGASEDVISAISQKLNQNFIAPAFESAESYLVGQYVAKDGDIFKAVSAHSGDWLSSDFEQITMSNPDAAFQVDGEDLNMLDSTGSLIWSSAKCGRYDILSTESILLKDHAINKFTLSGSNIDVGFSFPFCNEDGKTADFVLDVKNATASSGTISFNGLDVSFSIIVEDGEDLSQMTTIAASEMARFYITQSQFNVNNRPTYIVSKKTFVNGGAS